MTDWGISGRRDEYSYHLVDPFTLQETGETVDAVDGEGQITWAESSENGYSASISFAESFASNRMVRVKHAIKLPDGEQVGETLGTFFVDSSNSSSVFGRASRSSKCYSPLLRISGDLLASDFSRFAGQNIVDEVRDLVQENGGRLLVLQGVDESRQHTVDVWFPVGESRSYVLDKIASWTGCEMGVDESGFVTWGPYVDPVNRPRSFTFEEGKNCMYVAGFDESDESEGSVNRVIAHYSRASKDDGDPYPLSDFAVVDLPPLHPFSFESIGRRKPYDMVVGEPCSKEELIAQAQRHLDQNAGGAKRYVISHVGIPGLKPGQKVRYVNSIDGEEPLDIDAIIEEISMDLKPGAPCKTKLRRI